MSYNYDTVAEFLLDFDEHRLKRLVSRLRDHLTLFAKARRFFLDCLSLSFVQIAISLDFSGLFFGELLYLILLHVPLLDRVLLGRHEENEVRHADFGNEGEELVFSLMRVVVDDEARIGL